MIRNMLVYLPPLHFQKDALKVGKSMSIKFFKLFKKDKAYTDILAQEALPSSLLYMRITMSKKVSGAVPNYKNVG